MKYLAQDPGDGRCSRGGRRRRLRRRLEATAHTASAQTLEPVTVNGADRAACGAVEATVRPGADHGRRVGLARPGRSPTPSGSTRTSKPQRQDHPRLHAALGQALLRLRAHVRARR